MYWLFFFFFGSNNCSYSVLSISVTFHHSLISAGITMETIKMDFLRDGTESMKEIKGGDLAFM